MSIAPPPVHVVLVEGTAPPTPTERGFRLLRRVAGRGWGFAVLVVALAVTATVPGLQPLVLGYLLEIGGRVGRHGRLRDGFVGLDEAARLGTIVAATFICFLPALFLSSLATDARIIEPTGPGARRTMIAFYLVTAAATWHVIGALLRGGKLRHFLWPRPFDTLRRLLRPDTWSGARDATWNAFAAMRLPYFYALGLRTAICTLVWLVPPVWLLFIGRERPAAGFVGGVLTALVIAWLPWLQTQAAVDGGAWRRMFALGDVRRRFRNAPWAAAAAVVFTLAMALPLNLLKIELIPREAAWLPGIVFTASAIPARLALGCAFAYAERRGRPRSFVLVWTARLTIFLAAAAYVFLTYLSQATSWYGRYSLFEQHVVLFPMPFQTWR